MSNELVENEQKDANILVKLRPVLIEYLKMGSSDGNTKRQELRRELAGLLQLKYDEWTCKVV